MSRYGFGYANRQTVDPPVVKMAVLVFLAPMLAGAILWVSVSTVPDVATLAWLAVAYRPASATVLEHDHERRGLVAGPEGEIIRSEWRPRILVRYEIGNQSVEAWSHDPFGLWISDAQHAHQSARFPIGGRCRCWYDVTNPERVMLSHDLPWPVVLSIVLPLGTLFVTGGLMWLAWPLMFYRQRGKEYNSPKDWKSA